MNVQSRYGRLTLVYEPGYEGQGRGHTASPPSGLSVIRALDSFTHD
jgi:hypothetical protein